LNFLVDSQLPPALARRLNVPGTSCVHVRDLGLDCAPDRIIWEYAKLHNMVIISKDQDFHAMANSKGAPPQVLWVRLGNCRCVDLIAAFDRRWKDMQDLLKAGLPVVELR
jgi:predicted nuclease of predicted toxin-antitoxin system